mgnify:CR=1 FL=1
MSPPPSREGCGHRLSQFAPGSRPQRDRLPERGAGRPRLVVRYALMRSNIEELPAAVDLWGRLGVDQLDRILLSFAAYNAGPARIRQLREEAAQQGLDPDVWFNNVEQAAAKLIGRETVQYVSNIYKYYLAYRLVEARSDS